MRWFCDSFDSSGTDARQNLITTDLRLAADQCKSTADRGDLNLGYASVGKTPYKFNVEIKTKTHAGKLTSKIIMNVMAVHGLNCTLLKLTFSIGTLLFDAIAKSVD